MRRGKTSWRVVIDGSGWAVDKLFSFLVDKSEGAVTSVGYRSPRRFLYQNLIFSYAGLFNVADVIVSKVLRRRFIVTIFHLDFADDISVQGFSRIVDCASVELIVVPNKTLLSSLRAIGIPDDRIVFIPIPVADTYFEDR